MTSTSKRSMAHCWGLDFQHFGNGKEFTHNADTLVTAASMMHYQFPSISTGSEHVCALTFEATIECWGSGSNGEAGGTIDVDRFTPEPVSLPGVKFRKIVSSPISSTTCAIAFDGRTYCWGFGRLGQLGNGTFVSSAAPVVVRFIH